MVTFTPRSHERTRRANARSSGVWPSRAVALTLARARSKAATISVLPACATHRAIVRNIPHTHMHEHDALRNMPRNIHSSLFK